MKLSNMSIYNIYSAQDLLTYLRSLPSFQGVPVRSLKDGWNGCLEAIEELEQSQQIIVLRTKKENSPRDMYGLIGWRILE